MKHLAPVPRIALPIFYCLPTSMTVVLHDSRSAPPKPTAQAQPVTPQSITELALPTVDSTIFVTANLFSIVPHQAAIGKHDTKHTGHWLRFSTRKRRLDDASRISLRALWRGQIQRPNGGWHQPSKASSKSPESVLRICCVKMLLDTASVCSLPIAHSNSFIPSSPLFHDYGLFCLPVLKHPSITRLCHQYCSSILAELFDNQKQSSESDAPGDS